MTLLTISFGQNAQSLAVNGKEEIDLTDAERREVLQRIGAAIAALPTDKLNSLLQELLPLCGECETYEYSEDWHDYFEKYSWTI